MRPRSLVDSALAARGVTGDGVAFGELAPRYDGLIRQTTRGFASGLTSEDQRQEALIGLFLACRAHDPGKGHFGGLATVCVRRRVWAARLKARSRRQRILTDALALDHHDGADETALTLAERLPAGDGADPTRVIELRDELRQLPATG